MNYYLPGDTYHVFGLSVKSEIPLPELITSRLPPDVFVRFGPIDEQINRPFHSGICFESLPHKFTLKVNGVACYLVENGENITIDRSEGGSDDEIRLFLLGSAFGALIHQKGMLPIHGSAIIIANEAVIFSGKSGAGKSTLAAGFVQKGYKLLADDICVIHPDEKDRPIVLPGYPQMKLWSDALENLGHPTNTLRKIRGNLKKFAFPIETAFHNHPVPLKGIYIISTLDIPISALESLKGIEKFDAINQNTYRLNFLDGEKTALSHFKHIETIAKYSFVKRLKRPSKGFYINELIKIVEEDMSI